MVSADMVSQAPVALLQRPHKGTGQGHPPSSGWSLLLASQLPLPASSGSEPAAWSLASWEGLASSEK